MESALGLRDLDWEELHHFAGTSADIFPGHRDSGEDRRSPGSSPEFCESPGPIHPPVDGSWRVRPRFRRTHLRARCRRATPLRADGPPTPPAKGPPSPITLVDPPAIRGRTRSDRVEKSFSDRRSSEGPVLAPPRSAHIFRSRLEERVSPLHDSTPSHRGEE